MIVKGGEPLIHAEKRKEVRTKGAKWKVRKGRKEGKRTKGVPKIPDIQPSLTDQTKVISLVDQELRAKH
jgi:hypothetical protein